MNRKSIAAYTEETVSYPAFVSVSQEADGTCSITVRERGHDGNKQAQITGLSLNQIQILAAGMLDGIGMDVKRCGNVAYRDARKLAQTDGRCLELIGVTVSGSWAWFWHGVDS